MLSVHLALALAAASTAYAQSAATTSLEPLSSKNITWGDIPYQVSGDDAGPRGPQFGFNLCNSTTQNQSSNCQTMVTNSALDFCMWSSPTADNTIAESESYEVAWCTKTGYGTRIIPEGAIQGLQVLYAKSYIQFVVFIDQTQVNLQASDFGGELDPHGDDEQGNPLGGIVFTNGFGMNAASFDQLIQSGGNYTANQNFTEVHEWVDFIGNGLFCIKACNPDNPDAPALCQHIYDEIGCTYNAPADYNAINGTYSVCDSDDMEQIGQYVVDGVTSTWTQPFTGSFTVPYNVTIPSSSNCKTYSSEQLFQTALATTSSGTSSGAKGTGTGASGSRTSSGSGASNTGSSAMRGVSVSGAPFYALAVTMAVAFIAPLFLF
jgi:hypothetical protein